MGCGNSNLDVKSMEFFKDSDRLPDAHYPAIREMREPR